MEPIDIPVTTVSFLWGSNHAMTLLMSSPYASLEIHRAVSFYYFGNHQVPKRTVNGNRGIRIIASSNTSTTSNGSFTYSGVHDEYITILNNPRTDAAIIGTTLHELGHMTMYSKKTSALAFRNVDDLIKESWASFVGWYVGEAYYISMGWPKPADGLTHITEQARQRWPILELEDYSPLFIDLIDNFGYI